MYAHIHNRKTNILKYMHTHIHTFTHTQIKKKTEGVKMENEDNHSKDEGKEGEMNERGIGE